MLTLCLLALNMLGGLAQAEDIRPGEVLLLSEEMKRFVDERVARDQSDLVQLRQLVDEVFASDSLGFEYRWGASHTARETFQRRSGNCLSYTNMFLAMARYLGVKVRFHEVEIVPTWQKRGSAVFLSRHINVLAYIGGRAYEVDLFPSVSRHRIGGRVISDERGLAHFYNNLGAEAMARDQFAKAIKHYRQALEINGEVGFVWGNLGVALARDGQTAEAERAYLTALEHDSDNVSAMHNLARLYERQDQLEKAGKFMKKVEKFRDKNPYYHYQLGMEDFRAGQLDEAAEHLHTAVDRKKKEHLFHFALARVFLRKGEMDKVEGYLRLAAQYAPDGEKARYQRKLDILAQRFARK